MLYTGLLFGLPLAVTSFNRYSRLVEALCRRFSFCMASLYFDDAHVTDRKSCRGSGQQAIQHLNKLWGTPFSKEKCQRMQASGTFLGLDHDFAQVHTAGLIRFWARDRIQQKLEGLMQTAESSERLTPGVAAKIYGIANFFEQGVWGRIGCGGLAAIKDRQQARSSEMTDELRHCFSLLKAVIQTRPQRELEISPFMGHRFLAASDAALEVPRSGTGGFLLVWHNQAEQLREAFVAVIPPLVYDLWEPGTNTSKALLLESSGMQLKVPLLTLIPKQQLCSTPCSRTDSKRTKSHDIDATEARGPTFEEPCNPLYSTFPWEEKVDDFNKPASCTHKNWKHQCLKYKLGSQCATLQMDAGDGENGLNPAMLDAFQDAITDLQDRSEVRVVILKSTGKFFSNGFDPKHLLAESSMSDEDILAFQIQYAKILYFLQRNPDGYCFDVNQPMTFKDIYYKNKNRDPGEREFLVDDQQIDREKLGETLPYVGQKLEWDSEAKEYKPLKGMQWGTIVKGYEVGKYVYDKSEKKFLPKYKDGKRVLETDGCPKGQVRIVYSAGKSSQNGMSNGPEDESGAAAPVHTYHAIKRSLAEPNAAKKALCEVPPVRLQCTGGKNPKCIDADWTPPPPPKPKFPRICGFLNPTPKVPQRPPVLTWQIAREGVGGVLPQLTVALLQGTAMGAGIGLVCACDYVISAKGAFFTMSEAKLGAVPSAALPYITRRCTFIKNVYQLVLAGARLTAEVAEEYGFVDKVVDDVKDLEAECQAVCDRMTLCAPGAVAATKEVVMNTVPHLSDFVDGDDLGRLVPCVAASVISLFRSIVFSWI
eukprot:s1628_g4.t2